MWRGTKHRAHSQQHRIWLLGQGQPPALKCKWAEDYGYIPNWNRCFRFLFKHLSKHTVISATWKIHTFLFSVEWLLVCLFFLQNALFRLFRAFLTLRRQWFMVGMQKIYHKYNVMRQASDIFSKLTVHISLNNVKNTNEMCGCAIFACELVLYCLNH